jgi:uncharacterized protein (DUF427 family)
VTTERGRVRIESSQKRVRAFVDGVVIADSTHPVLVFEGPNYPQYYFPLEDVRTDLLVPTDTVTHSTSRGDAKHFTVKVGDDERVDAAWQYTESPMEELRTLIRFDWPAVDQWFEEDEEVIVHPRSPYTRVDILPSSRHVRVEIDGVVLADSTHAHVLHETGLVPRWYFPKEDVRMDLLVHTDTTSQCPYKGQAEYWSARIGDRVEDDIAWSYPAPLPESARIKGLISFYNNLVDLFVDGEKEER